MPYAVPSVGRGVSNLLTSVVPYLGLIAAACFALRISIALAVALSMLAAGFLMRTFIVFHDCAHGSFLPSKRANAMLGADAGRARLHAVRGVAPRARRSPRDRGRPRPARRRRHPDPDRRRVSRRAVVGPARLPAVPQPDRDVRARPALGRPDRPRIISASAPPAAPAQHPRHRPRAGDAHRGALLAARLDGLPARAAARRCCSRARVGIWLFYVQHQFEDTYWQTTRRVELRRRGAPGKLVPEAAEDPPVLHRQHRPAPRPPPERADPELQPAGGPRRESRCCTAFRRSPCSTVFGRRG